MDRSWIVLCAGLALAAFVRGKIYEPIELARELHRLRISDWDIPSLVCLAHNASSLNTSQLTHMPFSAMRRNITFYGIFGIPDVWLSDCQLKASDVTDENIENDAKCIVNTLSNRVDLFDRTDYLGALTPHVVDLNKCFDWWEHLQPYVFEVNETVTHEDIANGKPGKSSHATTVPPPTPEPKSSHEALVHPVATTCLCDSNSGSVLVDISLIFLNVMLVVLCYILYLSFVQRRVVSSESVQFI